YGRVMSTSLYRSPAAYTVVGSSVSATAPARCARIPSGSGPAFTPRLRAIASSSLAEGSQRAGRSGTVEAGGFEDGPVDLDDDPGDDVGELVRVVAADV